MTKRTRTQITIQTINDSALKLLGILSNCSEKTVCDFHIRTSELSDDLKLYPSF